MKYIIASDIHGSAYWCEKLISKIEEIQPDNIILLGDILYHGPRNDLPKDYAPKKVIPMLNQYANNIISCGGNCDAQVDQYVLDFDVSSTSNYIEDGTCNIFLTHGHIYNPRNMPSELACGDIFLYGHTHIKQDEIIDSIHIFNPGSTSIPKDGTNSIGLLDDGTLSHIILN